MVLNDWIPVPDRSGLVPRRIDWILVDDSPYEPIFGVSSVCFRLFYFRCYFRVAHVTKLTSLTTATSLLVMGIIVGEITYSTTIMLIF